MSNATRGAYRRVRRLQEKGTVQRLTDRTVKHGCCKREGCNRRTFLTRPLDWCDRDMRQLLGWQQFLTWWFTPVDEPASDREDPQPKGTT